jgi:hypothetical protein
MDLIRSQAGDHHKFIIPTRSAPYRTDGQFDFVVAFLRAPENVEDVGILPSIQGSACGASFSAANFSGGLLHLKHPRPLCVYINVD